MKIDDGLGEEVIVISFLFLGFFFPTRSKVVLKFIPGTILP